MSSSTKSLSITVDKSLFERTSLLRKMKGKAPDLGSELEKAILSVIEETEKKLKLDSDAWKIARPCPSCSSGVLTIVTYRKKGGVPCQFMGCSGYPNCRHSESIQK